VPDTATRRPGLPGAPGLPGVPGAPSTASAGLPDAAATDRLGAALAMALAPGDCVLLSGPLGAGKSSLARAAIKTWLGAPEAEVPSPSYTLVNVYETPRGQVWHADLYRLGSADETAELGLWDAPGAALVLVEWPERLGHALPARNLALALEMAPGGGRFLTARAAGPGWDAALGLIDAEAAQ